jgi:SagB-type dehydrogenase family enzyme
MAGQRISCYNDGMDPIDAVITYHEQTKHHFGHYARSLGYLDWNTQPDPFRRFRGSRTVLLPLAERDDSPPFADLQAGRPAPPRPRDAHTIGYFLQHAMGLSAWKEYRESRWSLRCNPSSGNLHPTEAYVVLPKLAGLGEAAGVFHYAPELHALEQRARLADSAWAAAFASAPPGSFLVALTSIHWREAWKYGERAYRYCQHDAGHALAALAYSAAALGWQLRELPHLTDEAIARLLGLARSEDFAGAEPEHPDLLAIVTPAIAGHFELAGLRLEPLQGENWTGKANALSSSHVDWPVIDLVTLATTKSDRGDLPAPPRPQRSATAPSVETNRPQPSAWTIFAQRRSAVAMDGHTSLPSDAFFSMLQRTLPDASRPPWSVWRSPAFVHLLLFVHRVSGIAPGLYMLVRDAAAHERIGAATKSTFRWSSVPGCPAALPLFLLVEGDAREAAATVSCGQDIAGDSAFSAGMIAEFEPALRRHGPWMYRRLFWETGMIGQVLYLEAEAAGVRGTGIGCFFDDPVHGLLGLDGHAWQSLYHFTVGGAVEDSRLMTRAPYSPQRHAQTAAGPRPWHE